MTEAPPPPTPVVNNVKTPTQMHDSVPSPSLGRSFIFHLQSSSFMFVAFPEMDNAPLHPIHLPSPHPYHAASHRPAIPPLPSWVYVTSINGEKQKNPASSEGD